MPSRPWEENALVTDLTHPVTPTKPPGNDWAGHDNPDAEIALTQSDEEESLPKYMHRCTLHVLATYKVVQRWVTGDSNSTRGGY